MRSPDQVIKIGSVARRQILGMSQFVPATFKDDLILGLITGVTFAQHLRLFVSRFGLFGAGPPGQSPVFHIPLVGAEHYRGRDDHAARAGRRGDPNDSGLGFTGVGGISDGIWTHIGLLGGRIVGLCEDRNAIRRPTERGNFSSSTDRRRYRRRKGSSSPAAVLLRPKRSGTK